MITVGVVILLIVVGIVSFGYYIEFIAPPKVLAARVGDTRYTQGDLVKRTRMLQSAAVALGQPFDLGKAPFEVLMDMAEAEIIRRFASEYNLHVSEGDIEARLAQMFYPEIPEDQETRSGQVEREFRENYLSFLTRSHLSEGDHKQIVEEGLYRIQMRERLGEQIPSIAEQVELHWIKLPSGIQQAGAERVNILPEDVAKLLKEEDFAAVARQVNTDRRYSDRKGYVGWVPKGAFLDLDGHLFGSEDIEPLPHSQISGGIFSQEGTYFLKVTGGPEAREISDIMRERLKDTVLKNWLQEKSRIGGDEGWMEVNFDSEIYSWVLKKVREAAPPATPTPAGRG